MLQCTCQKECLKGGLALKKYINLYSMLASLALIATTYISNSTCSWITYQEKLPEAAKELRKF
ncbi:MAG: cyclic lactone autoinducer peptide [Oscillospiraceae bacterium]|nr:cyclic lactone autoinducer peptide [Oscillospiraceae bacterium]